MIFSIDGHEQGGEQQKVGNEGKDDGFRNQDAEGPTGFVSGRGENQKPGRKNNGGGTQGWTHGAKSGANGLG